MRRVNRRGFLKIFGLAIGGVLAWTRGVYRAPEAVSAGPSAEAAPRQTVKGANLGFGADRLHASGPQSQSGTGSSAAMSGGLAGPFTSDIIAAPLPFSHIGIVYSGAVAPGASINWEVRASKDDQDWTRWYHLDDQDDLKVSVKDQGFTRLIGFHVNGSADLYKFLQVRATLAKSTSATTPSLSSFTIAFIDPTAGPTTAQAIGAGGISVASASSLNVQAADLVYFPLVYGRPIPTATPTATETPMPTATPMPTQTPAPSVPKPAVIPRTDWGCPDGEFSPNWPPDYQTVTAMIVHHTDTSNSATDWASEVRAVWYYHSITLGWGDIGYNYLVDPNGYIYEGRASWPNYDEDVVGGHALQYNWGSMGVAILGDYTYTYPSASAQNSLVNLLAWKAAQRGINPLLLSVYFVDKDLPTLMGHRDCIQTTCPGDDAYSYLPQIRQNVWAEI